MIGDEEDMKKICKKFTGSLLLLTIFISSFSIGFESKAYGESPAMDFYVKYSEPTTGDLNGYISVAYYSNGTYRMYTYFWTFAPCGNTSQSTEESHFMSINISSNSIKFIPRCASLGGVDVTLCCYDWQDNLHVINPRSYIPAGYYEAQIFEENYSGTPIHGFCYGGNTVLSYGDNVGSVYSIPIIHWNESVDASQLDEQMSQVIGSLNNIDYDTSYIIAQLQNIYNQNVSTNQKLDNMTALLQELTSQSDADKQASQEFDSSSTAQSDKINELNKQNTTEKVDVNSASNEVDKHIDTVAIGNYGAVLSVFTGNTHILQYLLIVLVIALISYVLFGKR